MPIVNELSVWKPSSVIIPPLVRYLQRNCLVFKGFPKTCPIAVHTVLYWMISHTPCKAILERDEIVYVILMYVRCKDMILNQVLAKIHLIFATIFLLKIVSFDNLLKKAFRSCQRWYPFPNIASNILTRTRQLFIELKYLSFNYLTKSLLSVQLLSYL